MTWNELEPPRTSRNCLEPPGTICTQQRTDTKKQKIHTKKLCLQYHCLTEYNVRNSYCHKEENLRCLQVNLERNETSNELTLIGSYCVYNIISLQNITLQIPIFTKSSILDVENVSQV